MNARGRVSVLWVLLPLAAAVALLRPPEARARPPEVAHASSTPSRAVYPPQEIPLTFDHREHVEGMGMDCIACHARAAESVSSRDRLLPDPRACDECHDADHSDLNTVGGSQAGCSTCHRSHETSDGNRVARVRLSPPNLRFNHRAHVDRNIGCLQCHGAVPTKELATRDDLPMMRRCFDCHGLEGPAAGDAKGECAVCHLTLDGHRLVTTFASGSMLPPRWLRGAEHGPGWVERHKAVAAADSEFCSTCHEERECIACHDGRVRPRRVHPNDWLSMHAVSARQASPTCTDCHRQQSFCLGCHQRAGVALRGPLGAPNGRFHPPRSMWTDPPRSAAHHAWEAQRNLDTCVGCHTERDCASCHATATMGGTFPAGASSRSPHPPGFRATCRGPYSRNPRPCLVCHETSDPRLAECR